MTDDLEQLRQASSFHPTSVWRQGDMILREARPWSRTVHALLRHLESVGFDAAPRIVGTGFDDSGREALTFIEGETMAKGPWSLDACFAVGRLLRRLHDLTATFVPPSDAAWMPWQGRRQGSGVSVISHCDTGAWNFLQHGGMPHALIDWERAGPVDPLVALAQCCWLNAKLFDDIVAEVEGLPPVDMRARQLRAIVDGYGLPASMRVGFLDVLIEFVVRATAEQADEAMVRPGTKSAEVAPQVVWALSWTARSAAWMILNRRVLEA
ncbi:MAG: phosphotransferase, partial [Dehalococcoidia bacterium]